MNLKNLTQVTCFPELEMESQYLQELKRSQLKPD